MPASRWRKLRTTKSDGWSDLVPLTLLYPLNSLLVSHPVSQGSQLNLRVARLLSALGIVIGVVVAVLGYNDTQTACLTFCPIDVACSCPRPFLAYLYAYLGATVAAGSAIALFLTFLWPRRASTGDESSTAS